jgi:phage tail P2-like protein
VNNRLLPPNSTELERDLEATLRAALLVDVPVADLWHPQRCPVAFLPWLAYAVGVEEWSSDWPEQVKRDVIAATPDIRRHRGTVWAVREALRSAGYADAYIEEGLPHLRYDAAEVHNGEDDYSGGSRWAQFRVIADIGESQGVGGLQRERLVRLVNRAKPVRSVLREVAYQASVADALEMADEYAITAHQYIEEVRPAGQRYDGSISHSQAQKLPREATYFNGRLAYSGYAGHDGLMPHHEWHVTGVRHDNRWEDYGLALRYQASDIQQVAGFYTGSAGHDGALSHGSLQPAATDAGLVTVIERRTHNGRLAHVGNSRHAGTTHNAMNI